MVLILRGAGQLSDTFQLCTCGHGSYDQDSVRKLANVFYANARHVGSFKG